jgi:hypothetical protein
MEYCHYWKAEGDSMIDWQMVIAVYAVTPLEVILLGISLYLIKKLKAILR